MIMHACMAVICTSFYIGLNTCDDGEIRLVDFSDNMIDNEGRLEVCYNGDWGAVCASSLQFGRKSASVVCNQLGFSSNGIVYKQLSCNTSACIS